jgi:hypothetical protein
MKIAIAAAGLSVWMMLSDSASADTSAPATAPKAVATVLTPRGMTIWTLEPEALSEFQPMLDINSDGKNYSAAYLAAVSLQLARDDGLTNRTATRAIKELVQSKNSCKRDSGKTRYTRLWRPRRG